MIDEDEIRDSYEYARRIQDSILPLEANLRNVFPESFILYLPKDIVSGDFYWIEEVNDVVLFAVADCTGHGVPGAMLTLLCHNALNKSLKEYGLLNPGHILDKTMEIISESVQKEGNTILDGMDICICTLTENSLQYSGANNPLWIIHDEALSEYKATKQSISFAENPVPFTTDTINLNAGDIIYLFTDGFGDQFGGSKDKKYKTKKLKDLLLSIHKKNLDDQKKYLLKEFNNWKGTGSQTDDICLLGVKL